MDVVTAVVIIALGLPTLAHLLGWADKAVKLRLKRKEAALPPAQAEALQGTVSELQARMAQVDAADERIAALEEQVRFLQRLLSKGGDAPPALPRPGGDAPDPG